MGGEKRLRLLLELDHEAGDVVSGRVAMGDKLHEFSGWLNLITLIEAAWQAPDADARSPPEETASGRYSMPVEKRPQT